jgi:hypothetical protein
MMCPKVLLSKLKEKGAKRGDVFDIHNSGKPKGKTYYMFTVVKQMGKLRLSDLD